MSEKWIVGVDLGGTTTKIAFITFEGRIINKWEIATDNRENGKFIISNIAESIEHSLLSLNQTKDKLIGIGMGAPGPIDYENGAIYNAVNLGWNDNFPLVDTLSFHMQLPAFVENDANCAALGEMWRGAGVGATELVCVTLGTGVGGGIITNGEIVHGVKGAGGEIGHITAVYQDGVLCNCGKSGCLETIASATGIARMATNKVIEQLVSTSELSRIYENNQEITTKNVFDCAREGDQLSLEVIEEVSLHLGLALANVANILNPERIILGGGVSKAGSILLNKVQKYFDTFTFTSVRDSTSIVISQLENDAGVIGAGLLVKKGLNL